MSFDQRKIDHVEVVVLVRTSVPLPFHGVGGWGGWIISPFVTTRLKRMYVRTTYRRHRQTESQPKNNNNGDGDRNKWSSLPFPRRTIFEQSIINKHCLALNMSREQGENDHVEEDEDDDEDVDEEDLEKLQAEIARMEEEAARITKETEALEQQQGAQTNNKSSTAAASSDKPARDNCSIYVGQVDYSATPEELLKHFDACGTVERVTIVCDKFTGKPKGTCVSFLASLRSTVPFACRHGTRYSLWRMCSRV